jgi:TetR/AcrR family transcriptional repressor of nem operon
MPRGKDHKDRSRQKILTAAGLLFRRHGYDGVGIDRLMAAAGLTRGAFYAHFTSKAALFTEVVRVDHGITRHLQARRATGGPALRAETLDVLGDYLDPAHLDVVRQGCTFAALTGDAARGDAATRETYTAALRSFMAELAKAVDGPEQREPAAILAAVLAIGGITIAGAVDDRRLAATILDTCRGEIEQRFAQKK